MRLMVGTSQAPDLMGFLVSLMPGKRAELDALGAKAKLGLQLDVTAIRRRHTKPQQAAYWACLHELGRELGYSAAETENYLHPAVCSEAFGMSGHRSIRCRGQEYQWPVPAETSSKDSEGKVRDAETYSILIDTLLRFGSEYGVMLEVKA